MVKPLHVAVGDLTSFLLDVAPDAPCTEGSFVCVLRTAADYLILGILAVAVLVGIGFLLAVSVSVVAARLERARQGSRRARKRILSGPVHTDGTWVRLIEDERGRRVIEVLDGTEWRPSTRGLSQFTIDVPLTPPSHG
jgi:hypothetical protein